jgi:hypothetical protein
LFSVSSLDILLAKIPTLARWRQGGRHGTERTAFHSSLSPGWFCRNGGSGKRLNNHFFKLCFDRLFSVLNKPLELKTREELGGFPVDFLAKQWYLRYADYSFENIRRYKEYDQMIKRQFDQRF